MVSLEQVKLLESKVTKAINYVQTVTEENTALRKKLDSNQKRIDELEILIQRFKEEQSKIEEGILSALERLNQFEDALSDRLTSVQTQKKEIEKDKQEAPIAAEQTKESELTSRELDIF